ncbi:uncharacterized protein LOC120420401 [Culex pipiens pallens]|uniref:uncharacterized protein LOC120420401 n=1 Tax=Culex pipiens pallens TaxID=42434 RepID=UPI0019541A0E|nr:uncharacterized protein LOC120420401 [Culex pipiens pallens]
MFRPRGHETGGERKGCFSDVIHLLQNRNEKGTQNQGSCEGHLAGRPYRSGIRGPYGRKILGSFYRYADNLCRPAELRDYNAVASTDFTGRNGCYVGIGCMIKHTKEIPSLSAAASNRSAPVVSHPYPAHGDRVGGFRPGFSGKYSCCPSNSPLDKSLVSSESSSRQPLQNSILGIPSARSKSVRNFSDYGGALAPPTTLQLSGPAIVSNLIVSAEVSRRISVAPNSIDETASPGRFLLSTVGALNSPAAADTIAEPAISKTQLAGHLSRPGDVCGYGARVSQIVSTGNSDRRHSPARAAALLHSGRLIQSPVEAPERPVAVLPHVNAQQSRPEPAYGHREGVFQRQLSGEYPVLEHMSRADDLLVSSTSLRTTSAAEAPNRLDTQRALSFYYQNVRGLRTKIDDLFLAVIDCDYDVIVLTETWLDDEIFSPQLFGTGYVVYRNDRDTVRTGKKTGGGICIAVSKKFDSTEFPVPTDASSIEQLWVVINGVADQKLYVGSVYISPDLARNSAVIESHFNSASAVAEVMRPNDLHLLLGDYNQPKITWAKFNSKHAHPSSSSASYPLSSSTLLDGMALLGMKQLNDVSNNLNRTLDLVLIDDDSVNYCSVTEAPEALLRIDPPHPPLEVTVSLRVPVPFIDEPDTRSYNFYKADFPALNRALLGVNWNALNETQNVDEAVAFFNSTLKTFFRDHVPTRAPLGNLPGPMIA